MNHPADFIQHGAKRKLRDGCAFCGHSLVYCQARQHVKAEPCCPHCHHK